METLAALTKEELIGLILQLQTLLAEQADTLRLYQERIAQLEAEIQTLKNGGKGSKPAPPDWVKPNTPTPGSPQKKPRKKRAHNVSWVRRPPTQEVEHACAMCPDCGRALSGGWEYSRRQIVEVAPITLEVIDHVVIARHCGVCGKACVPRVDVSGQVVGASHFGVRLVSLVAYLRTVGRLPVASIQKLLFVLLGLSVSRGQICAWLHRVAKQAKSAYEELREQLRTSAYVHGDETGWREDGQNGYLWSFCTPCVRYFAYDKSRGHQVPERVLGPQWRGVLISDFYAGYSYYLGAHQRCWVHLLRDVRELKRLYPTPGVLEWAKKLRDLYDRAKAFSAACSKAGRAGRLNFQAELLELAVPYVHAGLPQSVLCKRLVQFEAELFTFVEYPDVPSENNAAERSVRPRVIARKISGGTRSSAGSTTMAVLASLFETWGLRRQNALEACRAMLVASQQPKVVPAS
jgi:transposase